MSRVFWDTNLFIYAFEDHAQFGRKTQDLLHRMEERGDPLFTSWMTVAEVQIKPRQMGELNLCNDYKQAITGSATVLGFDERAAEKYALIRATTSIKGPDAIQLACAAAAGVELFVTNDDCLHRLKDKSIDGIHFIVSLDKVPI